MSHGIFLVSPSSSRSQTHALPSPYLGLSNSMALSHSVSTSPSPSLPSKIDRWYRWWLVVKSHCRVEIEEVGLGSLGFGGLRFEGFHAAHHTGVCRFACFADVLFDSSALTTSSRGSTPRRARRPWIVFEVSCISCFMFMCTFLLVSLHVSANPLSLCLDQIAHPLQ